MFSESKHWTERDCLRLPFAENVNQPSDTPLKALMLNDLSLRADRR